MEITEVRIGNFINHLNKGVFKVLKSHFNSTIIFSDPIPLTEEWLTKFGFELIEGNFHLYANGFSLDINGSITKFWVNETIVDIKYVHQLQNLFFALTGEELKIKK